VLRPDVPCFSVRAHSDIVTGLLWHPMDNSAIASCSKDGRLILSTLEWAERPVDELRAGAMAFGADGVLATNGDALPVPNFHGKAPPALAGSGGDMLSNSASQMLQHAFTSETDYMDHNLLRELEAIRENLSNTSLSHHGGGSSRSGGTSTGCVWFTENNPGAVNVALLQALADRYSLFCEDDHVAETCRENELVADDAGCHGAASAWRTLAVLFSDDATGPVLDDVRRKFLADVLDIFLDIGDVQTPAIIGCVLYGHLDTDSSPENDPPPDDAELHPPPPPAIDPDIYDRLDNATALYITLLRRLSLVTSEAETRRATPVAAIRHASRQSTRIHWKSASASSEKGIAAVATPATPPFPGQHAPPRGCFACAMCRGPVVRGVVAWCQGCGHGGHEECIAAWVEAGRRHSARCPVGNCLHVCFA